MTLDINNEEVLRKTLHMKISWSSLQNHFAVMQISNLLHFVLLASKSKMLCSYSIKHFQSPNIRLVILRFCLFLVEYSPSSWIQTGQIFLLNSQYCCCGRCNCLIPVFLSRLSLSQEEKI